MRSLRYTDHNSTKKIQINQLIYIQLFIEMIYLRGEKNIVFNAYQQLSFFTAEKSDIRVRATIISSVNFTIVFRLFFFF